MILLLKGAMCCAWWRFLVSKGTRHQRIDLMMASPKLVEMGDGSSAGGAVNGRDLPHITSRCPGMRTFFVTRTRQTGLRLSVV